MALTGLQTISTIGATGLVSYAANILGAKLDVYHRASEVELTRIKCEALEIRVQNPARLSEEEHRLFIRRSLEISGLPTDVDVITVEQIETMARALADKMEENNKLIEFNFFSIHSKIYKLASTCLTSVGSFSKSLTLYMIAIESVYWMNQQDEVPGYDVTVSYR